MEKNKLTDIEIKNEAIIYCNHIDFTDDKNLSEKGRNRVRKWAKQDFITGAQWARDQIIDTNE